MRSSPTRPSTTRLCAVVAAVAALAPAGCFGGSEDDADERIDRPAPPREPAVTGDRRPNFVVVLTDDQEPGTLRHMPAVTELLQANGVTYPNSFVSVPNCCPSRVSLLTGQYAHNHEVIGNDPPDGGFSAFGEDRETLPVWLKAAGYRTGYVGRYLNGYGWAALGNEPTYVPPGWDEWAAFANHTEFSFYGYDVNRNGSVRGYGERPRDYQTDVLARISRRFVRDSAPKRKPFFLHVAPTAPHDEGALEDTAAPRNPRPAPRHRGRFSDADLPRGPAFNEAAISDKPWFIRSRSRKTKADVSELTTLYRSRLESLLAVDDLVRGLVRALRSAGELERTVFVFTSDNGFLLGQHRQKGKNEVYEEAIGVPLVIRGPGFGRGETDERLVSNIDLTATLVARSKADATHPLDGVPLSRAGERAPVLVEVLEERGFAAIRTRRYVLAEHESADGELYDLAEDPRQLRNAYRDPAYRDARRELTRRLERLRDCAGRRCR